MTSSTSSMRRRTFRSIPVSPASACRTAPWILKSRSPPGTRISSRKATKRLSFFDLSPGIPQRDRSIEDEPAFRGIRIRAKIALPFELVVAARKRAREARLYLAPRQPLQRSGIQIRGVVLTVRDVVGIGLDEEVIVQPDFRFQRMRGGHPMQRAFHLASCLR